MTLDEYREALKTQISINMKLTQKLIEATRKINEAAVVIERLREELEKRKRSEK